MLKLTSYCINKNNLTCLHDNSLKFSLSLNKNVYY